MQTPDSPTPSAHSVVALGYDGRAQSIGLILLRNLGLSALTCGVYAFWGHVRLRQYLWQHLRVGEERLVYTGTGRELFFAGVRLGMLLAALGLLLRAWHGSGFAIAWVALTLAVLRPLSVFNARRHLLTRTRLLDVPFGVRPRMGQYVLLSVVGTLLSVMTLGALWPLALNDRYDFLVSHTTWGNKSLRYTGRGADMLRLCWRGAFLSVVTLGLHAPWWVANLRRYRGKHTFIDEAHLLVTVTGGQLLWLWLSNLGVVVGTLGLGFPWAMARGLALQARTVAVKGYIDLGTVTRTAAEASSVLDSLESSRTVEI